MKSTLRGILAFGAIVLAAFVGYSLRDRWEPAARDVVATDAASPRDKHSHDHGSDDGSVVLTEAARKNLGLRLVEVAPSDYWRTITVPGVVAEQPGHSERRVTTMVHGVVLSVHVLPGQSVRPGNPLFDIQPTGEALSTTQSNLLKTLQEIELNETELKRIEPLVQAGTLPEKTRLEREYERARLDATRRVQMQELLVRGLSPEQIDGIVTTKTLLRQFTIRVPEPPEEETGAASHGRISADSNAQRDPSDIVYSVEKIDVFPGKLVQPGDELCDLAFHTSLNIEGQAFEREAEMISQATTHQWPITAIFESGSDQPFIREGLNILYVDNVVDKGTRTFRFYVPLVNEIVRDNRGPGGTVYRSWKFKPGQKVRLLVPVEEWKERIVLPADAMVKEGPDAFVFRANGAKLDRVAVHVEYQDSRNVVLADDGSLFPGDEVAANGAYQINLALKRAAGSGIDPHAGHDH